MGLYERLIGGDNIARNNNIEIHSYHWRRSGRLFEVFTAVLNERARGAIATNVAARDILNDALTRKGLNVLSAEDEADAVALLASITGLANTTLKLARAQEISDVLMLVDAKATGYTTPALVKARLGV